MNFHDACFLGTAVLCIFINYYYVCTNLDICTTYNFLEIDINDGVLMCILKPVCENLF